MQDTFARARDDRIYSIQRVTVKSGLLMTSLRYLGRLCESVFYPRALPKHVFQLEDHGNPS